MRETIRHPVGGQDYPRTMQEFDVWFSSEAACLSFLTRLRWPEGFRCPVCNSPKGWATTRGNIRCAKCQRQTSPIAGTIFEGTRKPLRTWFQAIWYVTSQKFGGSALGLKRVLGFGSYQTAWSWLHKMRRAMVCSGRDRLRGRVEVDESYVGGEEKGAHGRQTEKKAIVAIAIEIHSPMCFGRVRMRQVPDVSSDSLTEFVQYAPVRSAAWVCCIDRWLERLQWSSAERLLSRSDCAFSNRRSSPCSATRRTPNCIAVKAVATEHTSGGSE